MTPQRIQRQRTKGWRTPLCSCGCGKPAIYVGRQRGGDTWANPYKVGDWVQIESPSIYEPHHTYVYGPGPLSAHVAVLLFRVWVESRPELTEQIREELAGHDLACWCPLDQPCHADVLIELANQGSER